MADRYRVYPSAGGPRPAPMNPARASLPSGVGYSSSLYTGDLPALPSATSRHYVTAPRGYVGSSANSIAPARAYPLPPDTRSRPNGRDTSRSRRSTMDSTSRPPVIITTTQVDRPQPPASHSSTTRSGSPMKNDYRSSDGQFYTQPASSLRSRSTTRPYHPSSSNDDFGRFRDRDALLNPRDVDAYRTSRPSVVYSNDPRHAAAAIDYGDEGYQYTNAGELARYDLDHPKPASRRSRHDSLDRGNYAPYVNYSQDQRAFSTNASHDSGRTFNANTGRPYESRGGPPPSTRGFDRINRGYEAHRDAPHRDAPAAPSSAASSQPDTALVSTERREPARRARPLSLHQDTSPWTSHHDAYYRSREEDRVMRDPLDRGRDRERDAERPCEPTRFKDDSVAARGFGIHTDASEGSKNVRERRRDARPEDSRKRPDDVLTEPRRERRESKREDELEGKERPRFRDKMAAGLGVAATAVGLASSTKNDTKESGRRRSPDGGSPQHKVGGEWKERSPVDKNPRREHESERDRALDESRASLQPREDQKMDIVAARAATEAVFSSSDSDDSKAAPRRHRASNAFNPNDTSDLKQLKEQLAVLSIPDKHNEGDSQRPNVSSISMGHGSRTPSPPQESRGGGSSREESRGRELVAPASESRQVRVVSPPRDKTDEKPLKGILKQPSARFPEDSNSAREGVAPHKEDKKLREAPEGARWTKINRKIVNPEALTIGKERFEVRDDFVIVLRVLSTEEIQAYAAATQVLRDKRRNKSDEGRDRERGRGRRDDDDGDYDREREDSEGGRRHHGQYRRRDDEDQGSSERDYDYDRERRRRSRREDEDDYGSKCREADYHHGRSYRERERAAEV